MPAARSTAAKDPRSPISPNKNPGGRVFRYEGGTRWTDCGKIGDVYTVTGLVTFDGQLYATTCDSYGCPTRTEACYRYDGGQEVDVRGQSRRATRAPSWSTTAASTPRCSASRGSPATTAEKQWTPLGAVPNTSQTYSAVVHQGRICVGTWPTGSVFRFDGPNQFTSLGRLGDEKEVMAMAVYNGKLYAGTLPLGQVYRYDGARGMDPHRPARHDARRPVPPRLVDGRLSRASCSPARCPRATSTRWRPASA